MKMLRLAEITFGLILPVVTSVAGPIAVVYFNVGLSGLVRLGFITPAAALVSGLLLRSWLAVVYVPFSVFITSVFSMIAVDSALGVSDQGIAGLDLLQLWMFGVFAVTGLSLMVTSAGVIIGKSLKPDQKSQPTDQPRQTPPIQQPPIQPPPQVEPRNLEQPRSVSAAGRPAWQQPITELEVAKPSRPVSGSTNADSWHQGVIVIALLVATFGVPFVPPWLPIGIATLLVLAYSLVRPESIAGPRNWFTSSASSTNVAFGLTCWAAAMISFMVTSYLTHNQIWFPSLLILFLLAIPGLFSVASAPLIALSSVLTLLGIGFVGSGVVTEKNYRKTHNGSQPPGR